MPKEIIECTACGVDPDTYVTELLQQITKNGRVIRPDKYGLSGLSLTDIAHDKCSVCIDNVIERLSVVADMLERKL